MADAPGRLIYRVHAIERMFERSVTLEDVRSVVLNGETIEQYSDDKPYPSRLILGWRGARPLHVVVAEHVDFGDTIVVTVYEPDQRQWTRDFRRRRRDVHDL